jgi:hypothetical protein
MGLFKFHFFFFLKYINALNSFIYYKFIIYFLFKNYIFFFIIITFPKLIYSTSIYEYATSLHIILHFIYHLNKKLMELIYLKIKVFVHLLLECLLSIHSFKKLIKGIFIQLKKYFFFIRLQKKKIQIIISFI